jgi:hypothetical protein
MMKNKLSFHINKNINQFLLILFADGNKET